jgi:hypothetical protein
VATDVLATIECVLEDNLRPAIESLEASAEVTDEALLLAFVEECRRWQP